MADIATVDVFDESGTLQRVEVAGSVEEELLTEFRRLPPRNDPDSPVLAAPAGRKMGRVVASRGHMTLLPKGSAYQFIAASPSVVTIQTIQGEVTVERWGEICQTK